MKGETHKPGWDRKAEPIGDAVRRLFRSSRFSREPRRLSELRARWPEVVGSDLAGELEPLRVRDGEVLIKVRSPALYFEMCQFGSDTVRSRLEDVMPGCFASVRFCQ